MKKAILALSALGMSATSAFAGGLVEPAMEPEVVATATRSSSAGIIILVLIAAALSSSGSNNRPRVS